MIDSASSDIVQHVSLQQHDDQMLQLLHFRDGKVLVLSENTLAFYKDENAINHDLGTGLIAMTHLDNDNQLSTDDNNNSGWVREYKAGFIGLHDNKALLITPLAIQLFNNKQDALYNRNEIARLDIPA